MRLSLLLIAIAVLSSTVSAQPPASQNINTAWGNYVNTNLYGHGTVMLQVSVEGQNCLWNGVFSLNGSNSYTPDLTWNNVKLIAYSGYNTVVDDVKALIMSNTQTNAYGETRIVLKLELPVSGSAQMSVTASAATTYSFVLSLTDQSASPFTYTMASSAGTYNIWTVNNNVGIGTKNPRTRLDLGDLRLGPISTFPSEGSILEGDWGNYVIGDMTTGQQLRLGVSNDLYTRAEIFLDNSNRQDGTIAFKTVNGSGGAMTRMFIDGNGNVGIGITDTKTYRFAVNGNAIFTRVKVKAYDNWPDFVFHSAYRLRPLCEVEQYIQQFHHLPEVPSAVEVKKEGLDLGDSDATLLKKIEELTLYLIEQNKKVEKLEKEVQQLKRQR